MLTKTAGMTGRRIILARYRAAIAACVRLIDQCSRGERRDAKVTARLFEKLHTLLKRLGPAQCGHPWETLADGCEQLVANGDCRAARVDLIHIVRKMRHVRDTWPDVVEVNVNLMR